MHPPRTPCFPTLSFPAPSARTLSFLTLLSACSESGVTKVNNPPTAEITSTATTLQADS